MRENFTHQTRIDDGGLRIFTIFDEKSFGIDTAKTFPEKGLTEKTNSLEFANCLPNQNQ
jgi:hypothetical protein